MDVNSVQLYLPVLNARKDTIYLALSAMLVSLNAQIVYLIKYAALMNQHHNPYHSLFKMMIKKKLVVVQVSI